MNDLAASFQRFILGLLLSVIGLFGLGYASALGAGQVVVGTTGVILFVLSVSSIGLLFYEGVTEDRA
ncbi:hypothetical protein [Haloarcula amylovorans]|uniref:hypothetical protein n=1 Tax=Haloarcula amylovorans TaxID=2562280 RepID=UPI001076932E|nr:hypothetical protein [Halomicroarcula amylolytica]